jgi:Arc/MetJ family transcription regulator
MRTTLTIDDDVAAEIEVLRRLRQVSLKTLINDALRRGLAEMGEHRESPQRPFATKSFDVGEIRVNSLDNIAEVLAEAEGEDFR